MEALNKQSFLNTMRTEHQQWEQFLLTISERRATQPAVIGKWSIKDVVAHITVWETWAANLVRAAQQGQRATSSELFGVAISPEVDALDEDGFNEWMVAQTAAQSITDVLLASRKAFARLVETVEMLSEDDLMNPDRQFVGLEWKGQRPLWDIIANQTYVHYDLHAASIRAWLDKSTTV